MRQIGHKNYVPQVPQMRYKFEVHLGYKWGAEVNLLVKDRDTGFLCTPNRVQKLCTPNGVQMGYKMGYKMGCRNKT